MKDRFADIKRNYIIDTNFVIFNKRQRNDRRHHRPVISPLLLFTEWTCRDREATPPGGAGRSAPPRCPSPTVPAVMRGVTDFPIPPVRVRCPS